ncbi:TfuA-like protein [Actinoplanes sp. GCM10030250]|uniref:TfuA-like protein n=1 Tax=Actinoplanes sp. GCM10030250 TaxID=3273376 RepID=UPI003621163A
MSRPAVFAGPSLYGTDSLQRADVEFLPPVRRGDLDRLLARPAPPRVIGIVDGAFFQSLSVSPKEVLRAVDAGVTVYGSSSMGALRAVECAPYGMCGVGLIYQEYQSGRIMADDEVAMTYDEETGRPLSEPLVNMRFAVATAVAAGVAGEELADRFLTLAKQRYFPERTVALVLRDLAEDTAPLRRFLAESAPDTKRDDALLLLDMVTSGRPPQVPAATLNWPPPAW